MDTLPETTANFLASHAQSEEHQLYPDGLGNAAGTYEVMFNKACSFIKCGEFEKAMDALKQSEEMCTQSLAEEGYSEDEIESELCTIKVQLAYVYQLRGCYEKAQNIYQEYFRSRYGVDQFLCGKLTLLLCSFSDAVTSALAISNFVAMRQDRDASDSFKRFVVVDDTCWLIY